MQEQEKEYEGQKFAFKFMKEFGTWPPIQPWIQVGNPTLEICLAEEIPVKVDLRTQGIPQKAAFEDQGTMTKIQELEDKLQSKYRTESVIADLRKKNSTSSVRNPKTFQRLGNIELYISWEKFPRRDSVHHAQSTRFKDCYIVECASSARQNRSARLKSQFEIFSVPFTFGKRTALEEQDTGRANGDVVTGKRRMLIEMRKRKITIPSW